MKLYLAKRGLSYIPCTDQDKQKSNKIGAGEIVEVVYNKNRNTLFHRKFFALLNIGYENQPEGDRYTVEKENNFELYRARVLIAIGHCDMIFTDTGQINYIPKSISYSAMPDNNDFERKIYNPAVTYIASKLLISDEELAEEVAANFT